MHCDSQNTSMPDTKRRLLEAAVQLMLKQGFTATTVDQVCAEAGLTKGSFFHYFKTKDEIGQAAVEFFTCGQQAMLANAPFHLLPDPLERFHGLLDFFAAFTRNPDFPKACLAGNLSQELAPTHNEIRCCCASNFNGWIGTVAGMLRQAKTAHQPVVDFDPESVAAMALSLLQGSILLAKAMQDVGIILKNIEHCRAYVDGLFGRPPRAASA